MTEYRFRAECIVDVESLQQVLAAEKVSFKMKIERDSVFPDAEVWIKAPTASIDSLRGYMRRVVDGHVMVQTLALADDYTGERDFDA